MTLGEKIQFYRKENKYSQEKVAELLGVSRQAVTKWESNQSAPNTDNLLRLASIYGISLDELINDKNQNYNQKPISKKQAKKVTIIWGTIITILIVVFIFTKNSWLWIFINLVIIIGLIIIGTYIIRLLVKALNKYIHTK